MTFKIDSLHESITEHLKDFKIKKPRSFKSIGEAFDWLYQLCEQTSDILVTARSVGRRVTFTEYECELMTIVCE